jgi:hypothetical protein
MAEAILSPASDTKLAVKASNAFWGRDAFFFHIGRSAEDLGVAWTFKPVLVENPQVR